jgi:SAM-dependent methyltransferase
VPGRVTEPCPPDGAPLQAGVGPSNRLPWPLPALAGWLGAWALFATLGALGAPVGLAFGGATAAGAFLATLADGRWRRALVMAGFPLSALVLGAAAGLPAWGWLAALAALALAYPVKAWRDAPFFPTPADALEGLADVVSLPATPRLLDAGCGMGHGLRALHRLWPQARLEGVEWSAPLRLLAGWSCPWARVRRADMWAAPWANFDLVYLFQRPESMARAVAKAERELAPGSWLVSLEFEAVGRRPFARLQAAGARPVWVYRIGVAPSQPSGMVAAQHESDSTTRSRRR